MTRGPVLVLSFAATLAWVLAEGVPPGKKTDINCEVLAPDGKPVAEAQVWVSLMPRMGSEAMTHRLVASGKSDEKGRFRASIPWPEDGTTPYGTIIATKADLRLVGGESLYVDENDPSNTTLQPRVSLVPMGEHRVRLLKPDGAPAPSVKVWIESCEMAAKGPGSQFSAHYGVPRLPEIDWEGVTDAEGRCVISKVPQGAFFYALHDAAGLAQVADRNRGHFSETAPAQGSEITHHLIAAGSLRGRVIHPDGTPAPGSSVYLGEDKRQLKFLFSELCFADAEGRFEVKQVPPSKYEVSFHARTRDQDRWIGDDKGGLVVEAGKTTDVGDLVLEPVSIVTAQVLDAGTGEEIEAPHVWRLKAGAHKLFCWRQFASAKTHVHPAPRDAMEVQVAAGERKTVAFRLERLKPENLVTGTVLNTQGWPAPGVFVALLGGHGDHGRSEPGLTDEKGNFHFIVLNPKDNLTLLAWDTESLSEPIMVKAGESGTLKLERDGLASIRGQIRDEQGRPIEGARFTCHHDLYLMDDLYEGPLPPYLTVGADGRFKIPRLPYAVHEVTLFASKEGYGSAALRDQPLSPGQAFEWNPVLKLAREFVAGIVVDKSGSPVPGVWVSVSGDSQASHKPATSDAAGRFRIENLVAGAARVDARQNTDGVARRTSVKTTLPNADLRIVLPDAQGRVSGTVVDHRGQPVVGAELFSVERQRKAKSIAQGRFVMDGLEKGWFPVTVSYLNAEGKHIKKDFRLKTGMNQAQLQMPERTVEYPGRPVEPLQLTGKPAPEIHVATWINTAPLDTKAGGKVRILDFWGLECAPCLASFPKAQKFWEEHQDKGIEFIAITSDYPLQELDEFLKLHPEYKFPIALTPDNATDWRDYDVRGVPTYIVIGKDGLILSNGHDWAEAAVAALKAAAK